MLIDLSSSIYRRIRNDYSFFLKKVFETVTPSTKLMNNWSLGLLAEYLMAVQKFQLPKIVITQAPRTLKSINVSIAFPAWILGHNPSAKLLCASYGKELATPLSVDCRLVMQSEWYTKAFPETVIVTGENEKTKFTTTQRGKRTSTSVGAACTGLGGSYLILDDPLRASDAQSPLAIDTCNEWFDKTWVNRMDDPNQGSWVVNMQRLATNDLAGYLKERGWPVLNIPFEAERKLIFTYPNSEKVYKVMEQGEYLHPERFGNEFISTVKDNPYTYATQYQGNPTIQGGNLFKKHWFLKYDRTKLPEFTRVVQSWDTAFKAGTRNDYSVGLTWGVHADKYQSTYYLLDVIREKLEYPDLKEKVLESCAKYNPSEILIEDKASGQTLFQDLRRFVGTKLVAVKAETDKISRATPSVDWIKHGQVVLPDQAPWLEDYLNELTRFPVSEYDDQVDATTHFLNHMSKPKFELFTGIA